MQSCSEMHLQKRPRRCWAVALGGFVIAITQFNVFQPYHPAKNVAHGSMGVAIMSLGLLQPINAFFRPRKDKAAPVQSAHRRRWELLHKASGYTALLLTVPTLAIGTTFLMPNDARTFQIALGCAHGCAYGILLALVVAICGSRSGGRDASSTGFPSVGGQRGPSGNGNASGV